MDIDGGYDIYNHKDLTECEIMQFTGLKDENGAEIYEGDIVQWSSGWNQTKEYKDKWDTDYKVVKFENGIFKYCCEETLDKYDTDDVVEVIGNIHENPELLED